jgi:hypothetical protein
MAGSVSHEILSCRAATAMILPVAVDSFDGWIGTSSAISGGDRVRARPDREPPWGIEPQSYALRGQSVPR